MKIIKVLLLIGFLVVISNYILELIPEFIVFTGVARSIAQMVIGGIVFGCLAGLWACWKQYRLPIIKEDLMKSVTPAAILTFVLIVLMIAIGNHLLVGPFRLGEWDEHATSSFMTIMVFWWLMALKINRNGS